ncbi:MAG TPA: hypothetical protein VLE74_03265 [Candidatus Saccharimonadales bacterium]|nr:hypothetical protein [Candidatus Saccharimonadales bacterium]
MNSSVEQVRLPDTLCGTCVLRDDCVTDPQAAQRWAFNEYQPGEMPTTSVNVNDQSFALNCLFRHRQGDCEQPVVIRTQEP